MNRLVLLVCILPMFTSPASGSHVFYVTGADRAYGPLPAGSYDVEAALGDDNALVAFAEASVVDDYVTHRTWSKLPAFHSAADGIIKFHLTTTYRGKFFVTGPGASGTITCTTSYDRELHDTNVVICTIAAGVAFATALGLVAYLRRRHKADQDPPAA